MTQGIYSILYRPDGRSYIGATKNIEIRFKAHKQNLMDGKHHNAGLQEAFDGASLEDFEFSILEVVGNKDRLNDREQYWMAQQLQLFNSPRATPYRAERGNMISPEVRQMVKRHMAQNGITQEALAAAIGTDRVNINRMLNSKVPQSINWERLFKRLDVELTVRPASAGAKDDA